MTIEEPTTTPEPVLWAPGWVLVASKAQGPSWHHRLSSAATLGTVVTCCGLRGRVVPGLQRTIMQCPECLAS